MLIMLLAVAIILAAAGTVLRVATGLGRTLLVAGLVVGAGWLLAGAAAVIYQRGGPGLLLLVLIGAIVGAVLAYRRLGTIQALVAGLVIVVGAGIMLV